MAVGKTLPVEDPYAGRAEERLDPPQARERRMARLFRRWPALSEGEHRELRALWRDRIRRARRKAEDT